MDAHGIANGTITGSAGWDTVLCLGLNIPNAAYYIRTRLDTTRTWDSPSFLLRRVVLTEPLSAVEDDTVGSFGKAVRSAGSFGDVVMPDNPIDLTVYPNPTHSGSQTTFMYTIPVEDADDIKPAGRYELTFDGTKLPTGRYIVPVHLRTHKQSKLFNVVR
jgi:hypothetical protein